jgi:hypothetical protein
MSEAPKRVGGFSLRRWSSQKHAAAKEAAAPAPERVEPFLRPATSDPPTSEPPTSASTPTVAPADTTTDAPAPLPPIESLTLESDFTAFMRPDVDPSLRRAALRKLFRDPRFNVMDGLDVYIDDYSKSEPIPPEIVERLVAARNIFFPPQTRVNAQGHVEDVPREHPSPETESVALADTREAAATPTVVAPPPAGDLAPSITASGAAAPEAQIDLPFESPPPESEER